jgi:phosphatidylglycerophosphate synthase
LPIYQIGTWLIYIAAVLTIVSMVYYMAQAARSENVSK